MGDLDRDFERDLDLEQDRLDLLLPGLLDVLRERLFERDLLFCLSLLRLRLRLRCLCGGGLLEALLLRGGASLTSGLPSYSGVWPGLGGGDGLRSIISIFRSLSFIYFSLALKNSNKPFFSHPWLSRGRSCEGGA